MKFFFQKNCSFKRNCHIKLHFSLVNFDQIRQFPPKVFAHLYSTLWWEFGITPPPPHLLPLDVKIAFLCFGGGQIRNFYNIKHFFLVLNEGPALDNNFIGNDYGPICAISTLEWASKIRG